MLKENIFNNNLSEEEIHLIGVFKILDYDLDVGERQAKFMKYDSVLCEICNQEINEQHYKCEDCYNKETDDYEKNRMNYGICKVCFKSNVASGRCSTCIFFRISDYNLNKDERHAKYKNYDVAICEKFKQEIDKKYYYYCTGCYDKETDIYKRNH